MKAMLMMPAIYRFQFANDPKRSMWGWHRAVDLYEAVCNILASQGKTILEPKALIEEYPFVQPEADMSDDLFNRKDNPYSTLDKGGELWMTSTGTNWLEPAVRMESYIPAKLGMQLIEAVKHPVRSSIKRLSHRIAS